MRSKRERTGTYAMAIMWKSANGFGSLVRDFGVQKYGVAE